MVDFGFTEKSILLLVVFGIILDGWLVTAFAIIYFQYDLYLSICLLSLLLWL